MKGWFERDVQSGHFKLRKKYEEGVAAQKARVQKGKSGSRGIFKDHPHAFDMILSTLKGMRDVGQPMDANVAQTVILGIVQALAPELLLKHTRRGGKLFQVSKRFSRKFLNRYLGWTWRRTTTAASKLPEDWEQQGDEMAFRVATLCKTEGIPPELVCNSDQTAVHLRLSTEQTYEVKGVKEVKCLGKDDKRQITAVISSTASGELVPLQLVFQGKMEAVVPKDEDAKRVVAAGWHLTMSENHWSNFVTMKSFVEKVLDLWRVKKCEELGLAPDSQKMVRLIDCWKVHISTGFREWMLDLFPLIKMMFVPTNCTSKL